MRKLLQVQQSQTRFTKMKLLYSKYSKYTNRNIKEMKTESGYSQRKIGSENNVNCGFASIKGKKLCLLIFESKSLIKIKTAPCCLRNFSFIKFETFHPKLNISPPRY